MALGKLDIHMPKKKTKKTKLYPYFIPYTKVYSKGINDLQVRVKTIKLLDENKEEKLHDVGSGNDFLPNF